MFEKVKKALTVFSPFNAEPLKAAVLEMAGEIDRLRAELNAMRSELNKEK